jgi:hypothetical protein
MIRQWLSFGALVVVCFGIGVNAKAGSAPQPRIGVNESGAQATLAGKTIEIDLPFTAPAPVETRVAAWFLSPVDVPSNALSVNVAADARSARLILSWPMDEHGKPVVEIGWYRIGYRIDVNETTVANGILSIGAIAPNLLELRLATPENLVTGAPISVRVFAGSPVTRQPFRGVKLRATLTFDDLDDNGKPAKKPIVQVTATSANGEAILSFPAMTEPGESATLKVEGTLAGLRGDAKTALAQASLESDFESRDLVVFHNESDKPLHKPGEVVHLRTLVFDDSGHAMANTAITLTISDPDNKKLIEAQLKTNRFGVVFYDWKTSPQLAPGEYEAGFADDDSSSDGQNASIALPIERYDLPEFSVAATMDRSSYLAGQTPVVKVHAGYLFGKPVAAGTISLYRLDDESWYTRRKHAEEESKPVATGTLDANGDAGFTLDVKSDFADLGDREYERYIDLRYRAIVTDASTGRSEPRKFTVRLTRDPVHIYLSQPLGDDREGDVIVSTSYADGTPVACKIELDWVSDDKKPARAASTETNRYGLAKLHLRYAAVNPDGDAGDLSLRVIARDPEGRVSTYDDTVRPNDTGALWLTVARSLLRPDEPIDVTVHGTPGDVVDVDVLSETAVLAHLQTKMHQKSALLTIPSDAPFHGLISIRAYRMNQPSDQSDYWYGSRSYRSVLYPEDRELRVKLNGIKPSYLPGAEVDAGIRVSDASGAPINGAVGVTVFDNAVAQRAETEEEESDRWFGSRWWLDGDQAGGVTRADLDKVDTSKEIPDDLELAAEALLLNSNPNVVQIEGTSDDEIRREYQTAMTKRLEPLGKALVAVTDPHLPRTFEAVQQVARAKNLDPALLDPWNTPYKIQTQTEMSDEVVTFESAGPDKRFGTDDDIQVEVAKRNLFSVPGAKLSQLLVHAAESGQALPANPEQLNALAAAGGLDLNSAAAGTLTPAGKPYTYEFEVLRRFYHINVLREDKINVWSSASIDYFSPTETRMDAALHAWQAAGHAFPATEDEARKVFATEGIDLNALRDPLGTTLLIRVRQLLAYTHMEQVKAGDRLQVKTKPVTQLMRAIQIVRSPNAALGETMDTADVVAQFLHPVSEQSGSDLTPQAIDQGTFKGNTGAIGGTVTDQTGAVVPNARVTVKNASGDESRVTTMENGMYIVSDLLPGTYDVRVDVPGFMTFEVHEVHVSAVSLTTVDVTLRIGSVSEAVTVEANAAPMMATNSAEVVSKKKRGFVGSDKTTLVTGPGGRAEISEPMFTPRLRHVFDETAYWAPSLETGAGGRTNLNFHLPDSLTTWQLRALASTSDGRVGVLEDTFKTFQPFFIDLDAPQVLTAGDEITLPVNLRNYTAQALTFPVIVKAADWFQALTPLTQRITVPAGDSAKFNLGFRASHTIDEGPLQMTAANGHEGDAVEKKVRVHPDGKPETVKASGMLRGAESALDIDLPANLIPGSLHAQILVYPNLGAQLVHSIEASLERPYGCAEQTISSTYPSLLFLELLKASKISSPLETKAHINLQLGYDRLQDYVAASGGITYWGGHDDNPDPALTAYGVEFLAEARPYVKVDSNRVASAVEWLIAAQDKDGSWHPRHGEPDAETTLFIAWALEKAMLNEGSDAPKGLWDKDQAAILRALDWANHSAVAVQDPYANALLLEMALARSDSASAQRYRSELISSVERDRDGAHWSRRGLLPFYGWGRPGDLETTAVAFAALRSNGDAADLPLINDLLFFLLGGRDDYGIWYSGQATVRVLQSLLPIAVKEIVAPPGNADFTLTVNGAALDAASAQELRADRGILNAPRTLDITSVLKPGHNSLTFASGSEVSLASAEVTAWFYTPWMSQQISKPAKIRTGKDFGLDFSYSCSADGARVGQPVDCTVSARRFGSQGYGMLLAEVGLPPGADVDRAALGKLLDNWTIERYELEPDRIVFYLWPWNAEGSNFSFRFTPRYAIHAKAAPASLIDYYNPDLEVTLAPQVFEVK